MPAFRLMFLATFVLIAPPLSIAFPDRQPGSNNKGKIEGTKWANVEGTVKGQKVPAALLKLEFTKDGKLVYDVAVRKLTGTYTLGSGDSVTLNLDEELAGTKMHTEKITIKDGVLTMTDSDGTELAFEMQK